MFLWNGLLTGPVSSFSAGFSTLVALALASSAGTPYCLLSKLQDVLEIAPMPFLNFSAQKLPKTLHDLLKKSNDRVSMI